MRAIFKSVLIRDVANSWKRQYCPDGEWNYGPDKQEIYVKLVEKGENISEQDIINIIGNSSWTRNICDNCCKDAQVVVELGEEPDYESSTASVCEECLTKALNLLGDGVTNETNS